MFLLAAYQLIALAFVRKAQRWSREVLGLKRFYIVPAHPLFLRLILRRRVPLPEGRNYYFIHLRGNRPAGGTAAERIKMYSREIDEDIRRALSAPRLNGAVFVANTPMEFGKRRLDLLRRAGWEVMTAEGQFIGLQNLYANRKAAQRKLFGKAVKRHVASRHKHWTIYVLRAPVYPEN